MSGGHPKAGHILQCDKGQASPIVPFFSVLDGAPMFARDGAELLTNIALTSLNTYNHPVKLPPSFV